MSRKRTPRIKRGGVDILQLPSRRPFSRRRRPCPFSRPGAPAIDYKDIRLLQRYLSEQGKIAPARISSVSPRNQRRLSKAVKRARFLALLPYVAEQ